MTEQEPGDRKRPPSTRGEAGAAGRGHGRGAAGRERELAEYLERRIKPGLNRGSIPVLARSIAKAIARREQLSGESAGSEPVEEPLAPADFEAEMHALQAELGEQWTVRFSVHGTDAWLTAETGDAGQHVEAPTAAALVKAVKLLNRHGGRGS